MNLIISILPVLRDRVQEIINVSLYLSILVKPVSIVHINIYQIFMSTFSHWESEDKACDLWTDPKSFLYSVVESDQL